MSLWDSLAYNPHTNTHPLKFIHIVERLGDTESGQWKDLAVGIAADHSVFHSEAEHRTVNST